MLERAAPHSDTHDEEIVYVLEGTPRSAAGAGGPPDKAAPVAVMSRYGLVPAARR